MANEINVTISVENKKAQKALANFVKQTQGVEKGVVKSFSKMDIAVGSFVGNLASDLLKSFVSGIFDLGKAAIDQAIKIEGLTTQLETLTGSAATAQKILEDLQEFAARTPFKLTGLAESSKLLLAFGKTQEEIIPTLQILGDVAAGSGADLQELTRIFGQVQAAGKLTGERLLQFQERAIPIGPAIAKVLGVAETAVKDLVSKGKVDIEVFEKAFASLNKEGGKFADGMIRQSKTLGGVISTLSDNIDLFLNDVGQELLPTFKLAGLELINFIQSNRDLAKVFSGVVISSISSVIGALQFFIQAGFNVARIPLQLKVAWLDFASGFLDISRDVIIASSKIAGALGQEEAAESLAASARSITEDYNKLVDDLNKTQDELFDLEINEAKIIDGIQKIRDKVDEKPVKVKVELDTDDVDLSSFEEFLTGVNMVKEEKNLEEIEAEKRKQEELKKIKEEFALADAQQKIAQSELDKVADVEGLEAKKAFLQKTVDDLAIIKLDAQIKEQTALGQHLKALQLLEKKNALTSKKVKKEDQSFSFSVVKAKKDFESKTIKENFADVSKGLGALANLRNTKSKAAFAVGKAAAIGQAIISTFQSAQAAFASLAGIPIVGPALGAAAAAAAVVGGLARVNQIRSQQPNFQAGGIVGGTSFGGDNITANVNSGELILNRRQQRNLFDAIDTGNIGGGGAGANIIIEGNLIIDDDTRVDQLIDRINDRVEFGNTQLFSSATI